MGKNGKRSRGTNDQMYRDAVKIYGRDKQFFNGIMLRNVGSVHDLGLTLRVVYKTIPDFDRIIGSRFPAVLPAVHERSGD